MHRALALIPFLLAACSSSPPPAVGDDVSTDAAPADSLPADSEAKETSPEAAPPACAKPDVHTGDECDLITQNCPDPAASCEYSPSAKHNVCMKRALGTGTRGDTCGSPNDCDRGLFCFAGHCTPACCLGDDSNCGSGGTCKLAIADTSIAFHVCAYRKKCHPFAYDCPAGMVCLFQEAPDTFSCQSPAESTTIGSKPGNPCTYVNECGESQACFTSGTESVCRLFCWLSTPAGFTPGAMPGGRFPADGDCNVGGVDYGTCTALEGVGGGLGVCVK